MRLKIRIEQPLFFRGTRPFESVARHASVFPPLPGTLYGMLRATLLRQHKVSFSDFARGDIPNEIRAYTGTKDKFGELKISAPRVFRESDSTHFVPTPAHLVVQPKASEDRKTKRLHGVVRAGLLSPVEIKSSFLPGGHRWILQSPLNREIPVEGYWISKAVLHKMQAKPQDALDLEIHQDLVHSEDLLIRDNRTGIALDETKRTAKQGQIYSVQMLCLKPDYTLCLETNLPSGMLCEQPVFLGGERRMARLEVLDEDFGLPKQAPGSVVIGLGPTLHSGGSCPQGAKVIAAVIADRVKISGYDIQKNRPKPMQYAAPAGSVWFLEQPATFKASQEWDSQGYADYLTGDWK